MLDLLIPQIICLLHWGFHCCTHSELLYVKITEENSLNVISNYCIPSVIISYLYSIFTELCTILSILLCSFVSFDASSLQCRGKACLI
uniref:Uncharacterized protein n=1 Tax=Arundo donax TaxID=35708 RepID=A0A0A8XQP5_ARUDO